MKVFISKKIADTGLKLLQDNGFSITINEENRDLTQQELIDICQSFDALLSAGKHELDKEFLTKCKHLKGIALHSVGYDHVDLETANKLKIPIGNTPEVLDKSTSDIAFLLMLAVSRNAIFKYEKIKKGEWEYSNLTEDLGVELYGKTLGIFGLGRIGYEMAKKCAAAFDMKIIYHNRSKNKEAEKDLNAMYVPFDELLRQSDVISVHANLSNETEEKFNAAVFTQMKPSAIFINTARGGLHNEEDLIGALESRTIWGAGLDVTNPEPMSKDNPLLSMPYVCVLPHIGSATVETRNAMSELAAKNLIAALNNRKMPHIVNPEVYN
jgi:glyoxylate reductase